MAYIGREPTIGNFQKCDAITVVNGQAAYTLQVGGTNVVPESVNHILVSLNGILQAPTDSFTVSGSTLTFASNLATGDVIDFVMILGNVLDLGVPSDNTVTAAKLNNDIISGQTALATAPDDTDEFLVSDAGTLKRIDYSLLKSTPGLVHIQTQSVTSGVSSVDFTNKFDSTYNTYKLFISNLQPATDITHMGIQVDDGSGGFLNNNYNMVSSGNYSDSATVAIARGNGSGVSHIYISARELGNASDESFSAEITINKPTTTDTHKIIYGVAGHLDNSASAVTTQFAGAHQTYVGALVSVRLSMISGNINEGSFSLFGVSTS